MTTNEETTEQHQHNVNMNKWLCKLEQHSRCPVVVTLLINQGRIEFVCCHNAVHFPWDHLASGGGEQEEEEQGASSLPSNQKVKRTGELGRPPYYIG